MAVLTSMGFPDAAGSIREAQWNRQMWAPVGVDPLGPVFISYRQSDGTSLAVALA